ncbi:molybdopterin-dependent oxidoreductase [Sphingomonas sp. AOB5]|uniref:molybdopterin-dependent oxidoreductase n=1 Tax=Sphingomonas sp. AOB5 TaxID=3034017 RepID=UPI0023F83BB1|nr:molybdopterin-dependent oxidoreductase [Sphingomonas sp. AOB5]MDF7777452.1 molybdopterin-dependent oxidoreductase [Sphingomonas sp. AOB5]
MISRRSLLITGAGGLLAGCDAATRSPAVKSILSSADETHKFLQRSIGGRTALAREFRADQMSPRFRVNGTANPNTPEYSAHVANRFADWRLQVDGLVRQPLSIPLSDLRAMPQRAQITRHDCVEGWSAIGKWQGPHLARILDLAGLQPAAQFIVFHCADAIGGAPYYESIDLVDAYHPQTIMAWAMNDKPLSVGHGAPVRLRVERQLGYKHAKYVMRIEAVASLAGIHKGGGGLWEDRSGYEWYAGI